MPKLRRLHAFLLCPAGSRIRASDRPRPMTSAITRDLRRGNRRLGMLGSLTLPLFTPSTSPNKVTKSKTNIKTMLQKPQNPAVATIVHAEVQFSITFQLLCLVSFRFPDFPAFLLIFGLAVLSAPIPDRVQDPRTRNMFRNHPEPGRGCDFSCLGSIAISRPPDERGDVPSAKGRSSGLT